MELRASLESIRNQKSNSRSAQPGRSSRNNESDAVTVMGTVRLLKRGLCLKHKKRLWILALILLLVVLCIPIKSTYKDGGTVSYDAILYSYIKYHSIDGHSAAEGIITYYEGTEFLIFPFNFLR